jgi:YD repeat-containing protein
MPKTDAASRVTSYQYDAMRRLQETLNTSIQAAPLALFYVPV